MMVIQHDKVKPLTERNRSETHLDIYANISCGYLIKKIRKYNQILTAGLIKSFKPL